MPSNVYECMFLLDTNKVAGDTPAAAKQLHTILEKHSAEVLASRPWEERKLAYPIKGHKKGLYYLMYFRTDGPNLVPIERDLQLNETVLRSLVLYVDPKMVDTLLEVARDERQGVALQTVNEPPADEDIGRDIEDGDRGPRRYGPRRGPGGPPDKEA
jgi:small subunit ribosomal protein S6